MTDLSVLARLEAAQAASFVRQAGRDPVLVLGLAVLALAAGFGANQLAAIAGKTPSAALFAVAAWALVSLALMQASRGGYATRLLAGPFQPVVAGRGVLTLWLAIRGFGLASAVVALAAIAVLPSGWRVCLGALATGLGGAALGVAVGALPGAPRRARRAMGGQRSGRRRVSAALADRPALLVAWTQVRRPSGFGPLYVMVFGFLALAAAAGAVATRNSGADVGVLVVAAICLPAIAPALAPDPALAQLTGRQPISLARVLSLWLAPMLALPAVLAVAGLVAGVGPARAAAVAIGLTLVAAVGRLLLLLHMLARSARAAGFAAGVDVLLAGGLAVILPWALALAPLRLGMVVRRAGRARWLER